MTEEKQEIRSVDKPTERRVLRAMGELWRYQRDLSCRMMVERQLHKAIDLIAELYYMLEPEQVTELCKHGVAGKIGDLMQC